MTEYCIKVKTEQDPILGVSHKFMFERPDEFSSNAYPTYPGDPEIRFDSSKRRSCVFALMVLARYFSGSFFSMVPQYREVIVAWDVKWLEIQELVTYDASLAPVADRLQVFFDCYGHPA